jgi:hypothetical protein
MFLLMYAATSRFANRCLRGGRFATIGSPLKFGLRKLHVRFTPQERTSLVRSAKSERCQKETLVEIFIPK